MSLLRYYVSASEVYLLVMGDKLDSENRGIVTGRNRFVQVFTRKGEFLRTIPLQQDAEPMNFAAFGTGELLLLAADELNHETRVTLATPTGSNESELRLFDNDPALQSSAAAKRSNSVASALKPADLSMLLSTASIIPRGDNLLLMVSQANYPVLELGRRGVVRSITLAMPSNKVPFSLLPSSDDLLHVVVGELRSPNAPDSKPGDKRDESKPAGFFPTEVDEFYPTDGSLARTIALEPGPMPVCAGRGTYTFLVPRGDDGKLQEIKATINLK